MNFCKFLFYSSFWRNEEREWKRKKEWEGRDKEKGKGREKVEGGRERERERDRSRECKRIGWASTWINTLNIYKWKVTKERMRMCVKANEMKYGIPWDGREAEWADRSD